MVDTQSIPQRVERGADQLVHGPIEILDVDRRRKDLRKMWRQRTVFDLSRTRTVGAHISGAHAQQTKG